MSKPKPQPAPQWVRNLRTLMEQQGYNPRSLSLKAGLNATAVRDMLEGRSRFPRYDTAKALATTLQTTPALLMSDQTLAEPSAVRESQNIEQSLELLTEIIARLQETAEEYQTPLEPETFATMAGSIYHRMSEGEDRKKLPAVKVRVHDLMDYERLRQRRSRH